MEQRKQTAVEWLESELDWLSNYMMDEHKEQLFNQVKAMEKEQIKHALMVGISIGFDDNPEYISEKFYNQTYGN